MSSFIDVLKNGNGKNELNQTVAEEFKVEGTSFDRTTTGGLDNYLAWKSLNKDYKKKNRGYIIVTAISMFSSGLGGFLTGGYPLIFAAALIEVTKMTLDRNLTFLVVLAGCISLTLANFGVYNTFTIQNKSSENREAQVETLENAIHAIDRQLKDLQSNVIEVGSTSGPSIPTFNTRAYNKLVNDITIKRSEMERLKKERHTYWQRKPNKRNKRTGAWMLAHMDKCTGSFCSKLAAKNAAYEALLERQKVMDVERENIQRMQEKAMNNRSSALEAAQEKQKMIMEMTRTRNNKQEKLISLQQNVSVGTPIVFSMSILFAVLLFIEIYQFRIGNRLADMRFHRMKTNILYENFVARKAALNAPEKKTFFGKKITREKKTVENVKQNQNTKILTLSLAQEIEKNLKNEKLKVTRVNIFTQFEKYGIGKGQKNFKLFKELIEQ